jgi:hypothetical protein
MRVAIFLNGWNNLFHLMLASVRGEDSRRLDSRYATSLERAHKAGGLLADGVQRRHRRRSPVTRHWVR